VPAEAALPVTSGGSGGIVFIKEELQAFCEQKHWLYGEERALVV
jgi:hypothetical protein